MDSPLSTYHACARSRQHERWYSQAVTSGTPWLILIQPRSLNFDIRVVQPFGCVPNIVHGSFDLCTPNLLAGAVQSRPVEATVSCIFAFSFFKMIWWRDRTYTAETTVRNHTVRTPQR